MPELPEVETVKKGLDKLIVGLKVKSIDFDWPKGFPNSARDVDKFLIGAKFSKVRRRGKALILELDNDYALVIHLKMTGQLVYVNKSERFGAGHPNDSLVDRLPDKSTRVIFELSCGTLYFNDQRKFGWVKLLPKIEVPNLDFFKKLGPEPLESGFTYEIFDTNLNKRPNTSIKAAILDQTVLAGVGNIYADESLWHAKIHPATLTKNVSKQKRKLLRQEIINVLKLAIKSGGSTDRNYVDAEGKRGSYLKFAKVFRREGQECPRCGKIITKTRVAGRGTHVCTNCQRKVGKK
ncbi:MAG: DNA-formamidopyrimidine glycosylase [bacterium]|nr:DNA-formamidopyrimidine glycosylase [bacterium]